MSTREPPHIQHDRLQESANELCHSMRWHGLMEVILLQAYADGVERGAVQVGDSPNNIRRTLLEARTARELAQALIEAAK